ncbi:hypothetical protein E1176_16975 [Fulvivirga sp. RKSG066]|nr:hypothetical protein [Fulvivirga aurantia]
MRKVYPFIFLICLPILLSNCSSGKKAYEQGDYYQAVLKAVNRLRQKPSHKKSRETLRQSYPLAVSTLEKSANNSLASNAPFKYRNVLMAYQRINSMAEEIRRSPGALRVIPQPINYYDKVATLKQQAAEESYQAGVIALERNTREDAKSAYFLFRDVNGFVPGYKDTRDKIDQAKFEATLKIVVEQIPVPTRYDLSGRFFQDKIEEYLNTHFRSTEFVRFYTHIEAERENLPYVDQYLRLQFDDFVVGETHTERNTESVSRDSVKVGTVTLEDGTKVDAYNTVYAKITTFKKVVISKGLFSMRIVDAGNNAVLSHNKFNGEFNWFTQWGSFNGDERALTEEQIAICQQNEVPPPPPQDLFIEFTKPIYNQLTSAVHNFYRNY